VEANAPADRGDIHRELGDMDDLLVQHLLALGPRVADIVEVRIRLTQEDELDRLHKLPSPVVREALRLVRAEIRRRADERDLERTVDPLEEP
jgi:hypothetical protein